MKTKTSPIDQHYMDDNGNEIELDTSSIDAFYSESAPRYMEAGHHTVRLTHYEVVPEKTVTTRTDVYTTKPYILLDLSDVKSGEVTTTRLYANFVPYFMDQIALQSKGEVSGMKLTGVLKYMMTSDIDIWVSYSREFGVQVNYREPRNW
jgi:hypothetical protein